MWLSHGRKEDTFAPEEALMTLFCLSCGCISNLPVSTDVNGCRGSKGHLSLPDSAVEDSSLKTPS